MGVMTGSSQQQQLGRPPLVTHPALSSLLSPCPQQPDLTSASTLLRCQERVGLLLLVLQEGKEKPPLASHHRPQHQQVTVAVVVVVVCQRVCWV